MLKWLGVGGKEGKGSNIKKKDKICKLEQDLHGRKKFWPKAPFKKIIYLNHPKSEMKT